MTEGEMILVLNTGSKDLQVFPASGGDLGAGLNTSVKVKKNSSRYWICYATGTKAFDIATDFTMLQGIEIDGASDDDLLFRSSGDWHDTAGLLTWDGAKLDITGTLYIKEQAAAASDIAGKGQLYVKNTTPCELWFRDDAGTETQIA